MKDIESLQLKSTEEFQTLQIKKEDKQKKIDCQWQPNASQRDTIAHDKSNTTKPQEKKQQVQRSNKKKEVYMWVQK